jgi:hypothetical protein
MTDIWRINPEQGTIPAEMSVTLAFFREGERA